ncbi:MAG TPA: DUF1653 domain-containing protein [Lachnospiraceae bacterium]|nr:DUF1653 domain-containing protein [Lachnospiraceae bacterium]
MVKNREKVVPGALYRHFKGNLYQIISLAIHSETREECVVYQALYGDYGVYVRPLSMFLSEVDHEKYPEITQRWRFEFIERSSLAEAKREALEKANTVASEGGSNNSSHAGKGEREALRNDENFKSDASSGIAIESDSYEPEGKRATMKSIEQDATGASDTKENLVNEDLLDFLDARSYKEKLSVLVNMKNRLDEQTMNHIAISLDITLSAKGLEDQYEEVKNCLLTYMRFEDRRLR